MGYTTDQIRAMANSYDGVPNDVFDAWIAEHDAEVSAQTLEKHADDVDREAAEALSRANLADVRCVDCETRYEERQEYPCTIPGVKRHFYSVTDIAIAQRIDVVETYRGKEIRKKAAAYREGKTA